VAHGGLVSECSERRENERSIEEIEQEGKNTVGTYRKKIAASK
jgi:hypothetical protein